ncbi:PRC-barrel domain-containing protein [Nakamurella sp. A5-74]|uniref:PRC-barrel domain-containing protein n=1 Tax=Nakamurella sp. A5-74 TaxID=3158264 RepID=A0AAU8DPA1_9ACTN
MSTLLRARDLAKLPVVTYGGEDVAQLKDIVYAGNGGQITAFTLAGRSLFSGPLKVALAWSRVVGLGPDAVIVETQEHFAPLDAILASDGVEGGGSGHGDVLGSQVLTDTGTAIGVVSDVIIGVTAPGGLADVVGYEIKPAESLGRGEQPLLIPLPDTMSASGQHLVVPEAATGYLTDDLNAFGAAVDAFRTQIGNNR